MAVIQHSNTLPSRSARLRAPRAILQVAGWNRNNIATASAASPRAVERQSCS